MDIVISGCLPKDVPETLAAKYISCAMRGWMYTRTGIVSRERA